MLISATSSFFTVNLPNSSSSSSSSAAGFLVAFLVLLVGVPSAASEAAARLPDLGVLGVFVVDFLGVAGTEELTPAAFAFSLRLILPKMTLAEAGVYCRG